MHRALMDTTSAVTPFRSESARNVVNKRAVTRSDLANAIHQKLGVSKTESAKYVDMVLEEISQRIVARENVKLSSFGVFLARAKKQRQARNPKTGVGAVVCARLVVSFKPSKFCKLELTVRADESIFNRAAKAEWWILIEDRLSTSSEALQHRE